MSSNSFNQQFHLTMKCLLSALAAFALGFIVCFAFLHNKQCPIDNSGSGHYLLLHIRFYLDTKTPPPSPAIAGETYSNPDTQKIRDWLDGNKQSGQYTSLVDLLEKISLVSTEPPGKSALESLNASDFASSLPPGWSLYCCIDRHNAYRDCYIDLKYQLDLATSGVDIDTLDKFLDEPSAYESTREKLENATNDQSAKNIIRAWVHPTTKGVGTWDGTSATSSRASAK